MSRSLPLVIALALGAALLLASEAIFSFILFSDPLVSAIALWSLIGLVGGGALIYYTLIAPRRTPKSEPRTTADDTTPDRGNPR
jgi:hypothetical protein